MRALKCSVVRPRDLVDERTALAVLVDLGVAPANVPVEVRPLSGGISNVVLAAAWPGGRVVLKQSLPKLRVTADWPFDRARIINERRALERLGSLLPSGSVPEVLAHADEQFLFVMSHAPAGSRNWKQELLAGRVDRETARRAGELLAAVHADLGEEFDDPTPLLQGRVDPYHRTAAAANADVAELVHAEIERLLATREVLVLGDWSPKNLLVYPDRVLALDFEVVHRGDPAFDVAFLLTHLVMKSVHLPEHAADLRRAADAFLAGYGTSLPEAHLVAELGCLLLARVDGKSPAEYLTKPERETVRSMAKDILRARRSLGEVFD
jgi:5-methylthioribose kinase